MTATNHALTGAIIASVLPNPAIAIPLALASHFVVDALPHFGMKNDNFKLFIKILIVDAIAVLTIFGVLLVNRPSHWLLMIICAVVAISPDVMWAPGAIRKYRGIKAKPRNLIMKFHGVIQWAQVPWGMVAFELPYFLIASFVLYKIT